MRSLVYQAVGSLAWLGLVAFPGPILQAQSLGPTQTIRQDFAKPAQQGFTLLTQDFRILEGQYTRTPEGDYEWRRPAGSVVRIPAKEVRFAAEDRMAVRQYLLDPPALEPNQKAQPTWPSLWNVAAAKAFTTEVQPILLNQCVRCHARPGQGGSFLLQAIPLGFVDAPGTRANLLDVLLQIDRGQPLQSPLLYYARTAHGGAPAAFPKPDHPAYDRLARWTLRIVQVDPKGPAETKTPQAKLPAVRSSRPDLGS